MAARSRKMRARVSEGIARVELRGGERWRFVTLTSPTMRGVSLLQVREVFNKAWSLFRKREWWRKVAGVRAGVKGEEFTLGDGKRLEREGREWSLEQDGYHFHIHVMICSKWVEWQRLGEEWTACMEKAALEQGIDLTFNTSHGRAVVDVRLVLDRQAKGQGTISIEKAVKEVSKYITKSESWLKFNDAQLVEVASVPRWWRAVELLGDCREPHTQAQRDEAKAKREARERDRAHVAQLRAAGEAITDAERFEALQHDPDAQRWQTDFHKLARLEEMYIPRNDFDLIYRIREELSSTKTLTPQTRAALKARTVYLDTKYLSDGGGDSSGAEIRPARARRLSLRALGPHLDRQAWLDGLQGYVEEAREWRRCDLSRRYFFATFRSLGGGANWYGLEGKPASVQSIERSQFRLRSTGDDLAQPIPAARSSGWPEGLEGLQRS
jgi:hypothetical protein